MRKIFTLHFNTRIFHPDRTIKRYKKNSVDEGAMFKAPDHCVDTIMSFARSYRVEETKSAGKVEMILN